MTMEVAEKRIFDKEGLTPVESVDATNYIEVMQFVDTQAAINWANRPKE
jgi:hypothetical protein